MIKKRIFIVALLSPPLLFLASLYIPFPRAKLEPGPVVSLRIVDRHNVHLREVLSSSGGHCRWIPWEKLPDGLVAATLAAEDKYFFLHNGVNPLAMGRAIIQNITHRRVISGASTISQQLIRNIYHGRRNIFSKLYEAWMALRLEKSLTKEKILVQYLNRICFGNQAYGIEAASRLYFDKRASDLSLAEAAFLAGLPRSPAGLNPYRFFPRAEERQENILKRMLAWNLISSEAYERAVHEKIRVLPASQKFRAPHFCDFILKRIQESGTFSPDLIRTTLEYSLHKKIEMLVQGHLKNNEKKGITNAAVVVLENSRGEILSMVGSGDFFSVEHDGQVNGALSLRQPGSTLKPFTYALALENGLTASSLLEDREMSLSTPEGSFRPRNYDKRYHGPVRIRSALACSYNIPAVSLVEKMGPDLLYYRLKKNGFTSLTKSPGFYGVGLTLGNGEVTLLELVQGYATLARGGRWIPASAILNIRRCDNRNISLKTDGFRDVFSPGISYIITSILADHDARVPAFGLNTPLNLPFPCAAKTGTSKDFRDNWTIGYTPRYTVGVWVGNFDAEPMRNISGITGCGPLFHDIMLLLEKNGPSLSFITPKDIVRCSVCPKTGQKAGPLCPGSIEEIFIKGTEPRISCPLHQAQRGEQAFIPLSHSAWARPQRQPRITFPADGDVFMIDPVLRKEYQTLILQASVPERYSVNKVEWWINEEPAGISSYPFRFRWKLEPGSYIINIRTLGSTVMESRPIRIKVIS
ncbi:MAG: penicillin-binding protein 1C [Candidatus Aminicenantes bacterium]|nr:penicillin-binding protein 1C [Candidatus Aminicenantes bacterium]